MITVPAVKHNSPTYTLRPKQVAAINAVRGKLKEGKRSIVIVMPTGAGKTVVACEIIRSAVEKGRRVIFLAHRRELITQCSDKLDEFGVIDHGVILAGHPRHNPAAPVQVASIQTLQNRDFCPADLLIIDEAHRTMGKTYRALITHLEKLNPHLVILGLTATPERLDGQGLGRVFADMVIGGTIPEQMAEGHLVFPQCYGAPTADLTKLKTKGGDYEDSELAEAMDTGELNGEIIEHWMKYAKNRRTVVFAVSISHSQHIVDCFKAAGVKAKHLDGNTPTAKRDKILSQLRSGEVTVVSNVGVLVEGVDIPSLEVCVLARPTKSVTIYLQSVGRILRPAPGKNEAIVIDHAGCFSEHGLPSIHREWTLEGRDAQDKKETKQCPLCQASFIGVGRTILRAITPPAIDIELGQHSTQGNAYVCHKCSRFACIYCGEANDANLASKNAICRCRKCGAGYERYESLPEEIEPPAENNFRPH